MKRHSQKGLALLTVLLVVAIVAVAATEMTMRLQMQIQRTSNLQSSEQAYWYALGAEEFARLLLKEAFDADKGVFNLEQSWAVKGMVFPLEDGEIAGEIQDLHACFNINAVYKVQTPGNRSRATNNGRRPLSEDKRDLLEQENNENQAFQNANVDEDGNPIDPNENDANAFRVEPREQFLALLEAVGIENYEAEQIKDSVYDWLDPDLVTSPQGAEDYIYEAKVKPYLAANSTLVDDSELRLIEGIDKTVLDKLESIICVIPDNTSLSINVNTLTEKNAEVLHAMLAPKLSMSDARNVIANRPDEGYKNINDFWQEKEIKAIGAISGEVKDQFTIESQYFKIRAIAEFNQTWLGLESTLMLDKKGQSIIIARKIGV